MLTAALAGGVLLTVPLLAESAAAATITASEVIASNVGAVLGSSKPHRFVTSNALGAENGKFYSLGRGGDLTLGFGGPISGATTIRLGEVTYGSMPFVENYLESVDVYALFGGTETLVGSLTNVQAIAGETLSYSGTFDSLKFVDSTADGAPSPSTDGFDIDMVELTASLTTVPVTASGGLLLSGIGVLTVYRRRKAPKA